MRAYVSCLTYPISSFTVQTLLLYLLPVLLFEHRIHNQKFFFLTETASLKA
jgi:hypothetical protein